MSELTGLRVLVVEDEGAVALLIEGMLEDLGCRVISSIPSLPKALDAAANASFDLAMLDVNLNGQLVFPVAEVLQRRQLPFLFSTGYGRMIIPDAFKSCEVLNKPFAQEELERNLRLTLRSRQSRQITGERQ
jgi:CheY-like chemotaxis protein